MRRKASREPVAPCEPGAGLRSIALDDRLARHRAVDGREPVRVGGGGDVVGPHHQGVLPGLGVVALAHAGGHEPEALVQRLGPRVAHAHLEGQVHAAALDRPAGQRQQHAGGDAVPVPRGVDGDGRDVAVVDRLEQAA